MQSQKLIYKKIINCSQVFYQREDELRAWSTNGSKEVKILEILNKNENLIKNQNSKEIFINFYNQKLQEQRQTLSNQGMSVIQAIIDIIEKLPSEKELQLYLLATIDGLLFDDRKNLRYFKRIAEDSGSQSDFISLLEKRLQENKYDQLTYEAMVRIMAILAGELDRKDPNNLKKQKDILTTIIGLRDQNKFNRIGDYCLITSLIHLIKHNHLAILFIEKQGCYILQDSLGKHSSDLQISYYNLVSLWLISFVEQSFEFFKDPSLGLIKQSTEIIQKISREKIFRVAFQCFRNLCDRSPDTIEVMVDVNLLKIVDTLLKGNIKDKQTLEDIQYVGEILEKNIKILTSFEKYCKELNSSRLEWSPVHTEKFWKENIKKFEENDFILIKKLVQLLSSEKEKNVAIACFDLGEFCHFHPFGRNVLEGLEAKKLIMQKAKSEDAGVRENALLALQKIMLHNWQIVGK